jgi:hypothetical protein
VAGGWAAGASVAAGAAGSVGGADQQSPLPGQLACLLAAQLVCPLGLQDQQALLASQLGLLLPAVRRLAFRALGHVQRPT